MSYTEEVRARSKWDLQDVAVLLGLAAVVVGVGFFSIGAGLVVGGLAVTGLSIIWPKS